MSLLRTEFPDFGPTFAAEKLAEDYGMHRDPTTLWDIMVAERLWVPRRLRRGGKLPIHRQWRERRAHRAQNEGKSVEEYLYTALLGLETTVSADETEKILPGFRDAMRFPER